MKKKGLIISTIVMVVVLIASLTTATYAWFTSSASATIDQISLNANAANGLLIGAKGAANPSDYSDYRTGDVTWDATNSIWTGDESGLGQNIHMLTVKSGETDGTAMSIDSVKASSYTTAQLTYGTNGQAGYIEIPANSWYKANGNGTTTVGAAIAVAQHTTKLPIYVEVSGGTFSAFTPLNQANPQNNEESDIAKVVVKVTGGTFNTITTKEDEPNPKYSIYSENLNKFITGGTYSIMPSYSYLADGYDAYVGKDKIEVYPEADITVVNEKIVLKVGEEKEIEFNVSNDKVKDYVFIEKLDIETAKTIEEFEEYVNLYNDEAISLKENKITANKVGASVIGVNLQGKGIPVLVVVYDVKANDKENQVDNEISSILDKTISNVVESVNTESTVLGLTNEEVEKVKKAVNSGKTITTELEVGEEKKPEASEVKKIEETVDKDTVVAGYLDINILIKADGVEIGKVRELGEKVELKVDVPKDIAPVKEGYTRTYSIIRIHNEVAEVIAKGLTAVDGKLSFETDKFSTYAIAYTEVEDKDEGTVNNEQLVDEVKETSSNPKTGDSIMVAVIALTIAIVGMVLTIVIKRRK